MIRINGLSKSYNGNRILKNLNLEISKGEFVFLKGSSGSGKSTLLKLLYREIDEFEGEIRVDGRHIQELPRYATRRIVGTIFQSFELLERKTALENVALAGEVLGKREKDILAEAHSLLKKVGLDGKEHHYPHQLSGGEQQRVAIARALLNRPKILLADEPTGNLDSDNASKVMAILKQINKKDNITMFVVTHSDELVRAFPSRTLMMTDGGVKAK